MAFIPTFIVLIRGKIIGLKLNAVDAMRISKLKVPKGPFLKSAFEFEQNDFQVTIVQLVAHVFAGGSIENCLQGMLYAKKQNIELSYIMATALDLTGRDVKEVLVESNRVYQMKIDKLEKESLVLAYEATYKYKPSGFFRDRDEVQLKEKVIRKLRVFLETCPSENPIQVERIIRENILNSEYWEGNLGVIIQEQKYSIKNIKN